MPCKWVAPFQAASGMDHLGLQVVAEQIYSELLPGLTNVTDRLWNYAFYPWFAWAYQQQGWESDDQSFKDALRRAEVLNTLIGAVHELENGSDSFIHGGGLVGRQKLLGAAKDLISGSRFVLDDFAPLESTRQYFANPRGGLGQYYQSVLRNLGIMQWDIKAGPQISDSRGLLLAEAMDSHLDRAGFFTALQAASLNLQDIQNLSVFCPCQFQDMKGLRGHLEGMLLNKPESPFQEVAGEDRRRTLFLILASANHLNEPSNPEDFEDHAYWRFREAMYSGAWNDHVSIEIPKAYERTRSRWRAFQRHELLSIALQGVFWAGLYELSGGVGTIEDPDRYGRWFIERFSKVIRGIGKAKEPLQQALKTVASQLPQVSQVEDDHHEMQLAYQLRTSAAAKDTESTVNFALRTLLALMARQAPPDPYENFEFQDGYFNSYPVNLHSLLGLNTAEMSLEAWIAYVVREWGIKAHLRVAFRKLYGEHLDTFKVIPEDDHLAIVSQEDIPRPNWTSPRLHNAIRMLLDLGLLERNLSISKRGKALLVSEGFNG